MYYTKNLAMFLPLPFRRGDRGALSLSLGDKPASALRLLIIILRGFCKTRYFEVFFNLS